MNKIQSLIKICGIKSQGDLQLSIECGAGAVGFIVGQYQQGRDFIEIELARELIEATSQQVLSVLVTLETELLKVKNLIRIAAPCAVQLHGNTSAADIFRLRDAFPELMILKAFHLRTEQDLDFGRQFEEAVDGFIVDAIDQQTGRTGGTGCLVDWQLAREVVQNYSVPVILAGGLSAANVSEAIKTVRPAGVDVNSGVKGADGFKDRNKVESFICNARSAFAEF